MANLLRYDPFDDRFEDVVRSFFKPLLSQSDGAPALQIRIDVEEDEKAYFVHAEIPGVNKEDINVTIDGNQVAIAAEVKREREVAEGKRLLRAERFSGKLYRSFALAQEVDDAAAEAAYTSGVLHLQLPKKALQTARKLAIQ